MSELGKYNLLLTNQRRVRWLWWGLLLFIAGGGSLLALQVPGSFAVFATGVAGLVVLIIAYDKVFRQPAWVLVANDSIAWANPVVDPPSKLDFSELCAYRFELYRQGIKLYLYLRGGEKITVDGRFDKEFATLEQAFSQAIQRYNQAHPDAPVTQEKIFFERPISSKILLGLLATGAVWVAWCSWQQVSAVAYVPVLLGPVLYLALWAAYSGRRE